MTLPTEPNFDSDVLMFWALIFKIVMDGEKRLAAHIIAHDLTPPQFYVLKTLSEHHGRCRIGQIANEHHLTNATMTGLIKRLEAMNPPLVRRETNVHDRRSVYVIMTPAGSERFMAIQIGLIQQAQEVLRLLSDDERQDLIHYLTTYVNAVEERFPVDAIRTETRVE